jgi:hypothetical protein
MRWFRRVVRRTHAEADLDAEIRFHLEEEARLRVERGDAPDAARTSARRLFGNVTRVRETTRDMWAWSGVLSAWRSLSLISRSFTQAWGFATAAILTVALGIGANTMAFSLFDRVLFRPLPYADPDRLVQIQTRDGPLGVNGPDGATLDLAILLALAQQPGIFTDIAWASGGNWATGGGAVPMTPIAGSNPELWLTSVTWNALDVLGVRPVIGPGFSAEVRADAARPVLVTYETWQRRYGGTDDVLSRSWTAPDLASLGSTARWRVVGVLPKDFLLPTSRSLRGEYDGIVGIDPRLDRQPPALRTIGVAPFARLPSGVTLAAARARANTIVSLGFGRANVTIEPLQAGMGVAVRPYVWLAVAGAWAVLAATCLTLAMLLLTWSHSRRHAAGVRLALGASPRRLVVTAVLESVVLCGAGALAGWFAYQRTRAFVIGAVPLGLRPFVAEAVDIRVIAATCGIAIVTAVAAGALPAIRISRVAPLDVMRPRQDAALLDRLEGGPVLLAAQAAFGVMLLVGASATGPGVLGAILKSPGIRRRRSLHRRRPDIRRRVGRERVGAGAARLCRDGRDQPDAWRGGRHLVERKPIPHAGDGPHWEQKIRAARFRRTRTGRWRGILSYTRHADRRGSRVLSRRYSAAGARGGRQRERRPRVLAERAGRRGHRPNRVDVRRSCRCRRCRRGHPPRVGHARRSHPLSAAQREDVLSTGERVSLELIRRHRPHGAGTDPGPGADWKATA